MRISATDIDDGKNSIVEYELHPINDEERGYFRVDRGTGVITLNRTIDVRKEFSKPDRNNATQPLWLRPSI